MTSATTLLRSLLVYGLCLPLAAFLGYLLATPAELTSVTTIGLVLFILMVPLFLRWHHPWLIASWNTTAVLFFLPGHPPLWMGLAALSLVIALLQYALNREKRFLPAPSVAWPLLFFTLIVLATAQLTGGFGLRAFGSEVYGGRRYFMLLAAIGGYFAITSRRIPPHRGVLYVSLFFLGFITLTLADLAGKIGSGLSLLLFIFPSEDPGSLTNDPMVAQSTSLMSRSGGFMLMGLGVSCAMLARYNLRDLFDLRNPLRLLVFLFFVTVGLWGGFRSLLIQLLLVVGILFWLEGLHKSRALPVAVVAVLLGGALLAGFANRLPLTIQRAVAFLPIDIDPGVRMDAEFSTEWRIRMWQDVMPQVPRYLLLGKGYGFNPNELEISQISASGRASSEGSEMVGNYHNGPLSIIIPFGLFGVFAFLWFIAAATRVLYRNYKFGEPECGRLNTFLFAFFLAKVLFFLTVFGSLFVEMATFTGLVGLSVSLNGGVAKPEFAAPEPNILLSRFRLSPGVRKPVGI